MAFVLLKVGRRRPKSTKQAEIRLADLMKILRIGRCEERKFLAGSAGYMQELYCAEFPQDMANSPQNAGFVI
ncbi:hypothetical protein [Bradyrhizobium sp.]|uniref:hypothetical protein n=1 Tax=Bradyrhizobium sp. TaxID=376 RepID=UPI002D80B171|nr:hypothetical protein [Bradyrhizobium sp.]